MEARSMVAGAAAFFVYACCVCWVMMRYKPPAMWVTASLLLVWLGIALGVWGIWLR